MMGYDDAAAMGLELGGDVMSQIGAKQGAKALQAQQQQQLAEQLGFQTQANQRLGLMMSNNNPTATAQRFGIQTSQPGQAYLAALGQARPPVGLMSAGAGKSFTQTSGQNTGNLQAAQSRLRLMSGINRGNVQLEQGQAQAGSDITGIREKAAQQSGLYDLADQVAATKGMGLRAAGGLMSGLGQTGGGGGAQGMSRLFAGGMSGSGY